MLQEGRWGDLQQAQAMEISHAFINVVTSHTALGTLGCVFPLDLSSWGSDFHLLAYRMCTITFEYLQKDSMPTSAFPDSTGPHVLPKPTGA